MGKLKSKLRKNQNTTNISFYLIYLPKLLKNFLKYCRLHLFKEIAISFSHGLPKSSESLANIFNGLLA